MTTYFQYLLLFATLLAGCDQKQNAPARTEPLSKKSETRYLITEDGDTIPTDVTIPAREKQIDPDSVASPKEVPLKAPPKVVPAYTNVHPAGTPKVVQVPENLTVIIPGKDGVPLPETVPATGTTVPAIQPKPVPALPFRMKDAAIFDIQYLDVDQGMISSYVWTMLEDSQGNVWFGTVEGVSRYDGTSFMHFTTDQGLSSNIVFTIAEDSRGNLWFGTGGGGLSRYDGTSFTHFNTEQLGMNGVWSIAEDSRGNLWFGTAGGGVSRYDPTANAGQGSFTHFTTEQGLIHNRVTSILEDSHGNLWFGTEGGGVSRYDGTSFTQFTTEQGLSHNWVRCILEDSRGNVWFGTDGGVCHYNPDSYKGKAGFTHFTSEKGLSPNNVSSILEDSQGNVWFGTGSGGVIRYDGTSFTQFTTEQGLSHNEVQSILEDSQGNLWFGTMGGGVSRYDATSFMHFTAEQGLSPNNVSSILEDSQGNLWFGTEGSGVSRYDPDGYKGQGSLTYFTTEQGLSSNFIWSIAEDNRDNLWFGTYGGGVTRYDPDAYKGQGSFTYFTTEHGLSHNRVRSILEDNRGNLWFGTDGGVSRYDPDVYNGQGSLPAGKAGFTHFNIERRLIGASSILDSRGNLWFGGYGVSRYDPSANSGQGSFTHFTTGQGFSHNIVRSILEDSRGNLWFGTWGGGLKLFDYSANAGQGSLPALPAGRPAGKAGFTHFTTEDGLINNFVCSIAEDKQNNLWISTQKGITLLVPFPGESPQTNDSEGSPLGQIFTFGKEDGLKRLDFEANSVCLDHSNRIWWGTLDGVTMLDLNEFELPTHPPRISLEHVEVKDEFLDFRRLSDSTYRAGFSFGKDLSRSFDSVALFYNYPLDLTLPYHLNHLTFYFSAIDWAAPHKIRYRYKLDDDDWSAPKSESKADYRNIPYGKHTFQVKAVGVARVESEPFEYTFTIRPPWWLSPWAWIFYVLAGILFIYSIVRWRTAEKTKKLKEANLLNERLQQVDKLKDQFLANTSHELRTPLQGIIGLSESLVERVDQPDQQEDLSMIISSGKRLNSLVNDILDFSKLKNYDIELLRKPVNLRALVDIVLRNNAPLVRNKKLELINAIPEDLPAADADENRLQQVFYNLVGNAIKFTETGVVKVSAVQKDEKIQVAVVDTGTGIPENKRDAIFQEFEQGDGSTVREFAGTGLGLSISKRLVELHGGEMWVESTYAEASVDKSEVSTGSTFFFTLPVSTEKATTLPVAGTRLAVSGLTSSVPSVGAAMAVEGKIRLLVVDDEPINQQVLKNHLSKQDFHLTQAMNGEEAIEIINSSEPFDLILLDVMMPRMSGYEVCQKIREKYLPSELPVIMVTAKNQLQDVVQGLSMGANDYLPKPFHKEELLARINTQLDLHRIFKVADKFVPNAFLHSLNRDRLTEVMLGDHTEQEVTVLFADIRDYTSLSETMTPEQNFKFVNAFHGRMGPVIQQHGGFVNQYQGDGIMAIFPHRPEDALEAAIAMQQRLMEYNQERRSIGRKAIRMGIGLHTGPLIMGIIGDQNRMDAATIADTVNTASRIESLTKHYGTSILLSTDSVEKMKDNSKFHFRHLGKVQVKGKKEPIDIYECFDGDVPEVAEQKSKTIFDFNKGLTYYFSREFPEASGAFNQVLKTNPDDQTARLFLNKSSIYTVEGVPDNWTGVEVMTFK